MLVALILAVALAGTAVALAGREGDPQFTAAQQNLLPVGAPELQRLLLTTSDPRPGYSGRAQAVRCARGSEGGLGNPWNCTVRYLRTPRVRYGVTVYADRSIYGRGEPEGAALRGALVVRGCCVAQAP
jgi:hypothetical protein